MNDFQRKARQPLRARRPNSTRNGGGQEKPRKLVCSQTEKMVLKRFNKEFMGAVSAVTGQESIPLKIDCYQFVMLLV